MKHNKIFLMLFGLGMSYGIMAQKPTNNNKTTPNNTKVNTNTTTECNASVQLNKCVEALKPMGYKFLKSYKLEGKSSKPLEYEYTLSKGTTYLISMTNADPSTKLKVALYDNDGKMIASSYNTDIKKYFPSVQMTVQRTGIYKLKFSHESSKDYCAASVLGFKR
ncbi:MAG: hypothetical protein MUC49_10555 [Raineya sp.]|jgi:hypothetical protein|nr:hypothetical protein [Raineya sp.]